MLVGSTVTVGGGSVGVMCTPDGVGVLVLVGGANVGVAVAVCRFLIAAAVAQHGLCIAIHTDHAY